MKKRLTRTNRKKLIYGEKAKPPPRKRGTKQARKKKY